MRGRTNFHSPGTPGHGARSRTHPTVQRQAGSPDNSAWRRRARSAGTHRLCGLQPPSRRALAMSTKNGPLRPSGSLRAWIPPPRRDRCAGRGEAQQSLPACRYSGHGSPLPRMVALRAHLLDSCPPVRGSHHGAPLGDQATAQQSGSPRAWLHRVPAHPTEQAPPASLGDRSAPGRRGRRRRAGSRPRCNRRCNRRRTGTLNCTGRRAARRSGGPLAPVGWKRQRHP